jgi:cytochrome c
MRERPCTRGQWIKRKSPSALVFLLVASTLVLANIACAQQPRYGIGKPATPLEIAGWDIDVRPDGQGLPKGRGSVQEGQAVYDAKCASCHGTFGESNDYIQIAGGVGTLKSDQPVRTVGSKLNYATTLWDYINRAMPFTAPKTLTPDEVYALTAYVLNLNDILPADAVLDQESLPRVRMPNRDGFTTAHGFMRKDGKPDVRNPACMRDCAQQAEVRSQLPEHARDSHGDVAVQSRAVAMVSDQKGRADLPASAASQLATKNGCTACHAVEQPLVGPGFRQIATRYKGQAQAEQVLVAKLKAGGSGNWGQVAMPAQTHVPESDLRRLVQWVLAGAN